MSTTANIKAKGCQSTGITEELAKRCHDQLGRKVLAIVELKADSRTENLDGDERVQLTILTCEPAPNAQTEDHLRELARSFYYERQLADGEAPTLNLDGSPEPDVETVLAAGAKHRAHPYLSSSLAIDDNAICDVCGQLEDAGVHRDQAALGDPFAPAADVDHEQDDDVDEEDDEEAQAQLEEPEEDHTPDFDPFA